MHIYNLVIESTRKCNIQCSHCLRGSAQRMNCSSEVIFKLFSEVESISVLTITGGEPSLVPEVIENIYNEIMYHKVDIGSIYCVSNGHIHNKYRAFLEAFSKIYNIVNEQNEEISQLSISRDQFHSPFWDEKYLYKLMDYQEYEFPFINLESRKEIIRYVISEGRGAKISGSREYPNYGIEFDEDGNMIEGELYISANGNVVLNCNMSYNNIDRNYIGNILEESLSDMFDRYRENKVEKAA